MYGNSILNRVLELQTEILDLFPDDKYFNGLFERSPDAIKYFEVYESVFKLLDASSWIDLKQKAKIHYNDTPRPLNWKETFFNHLNEIV